MSWLPLHSTAFWAALALVLAGVTIAIAGLVTRLKASKRSPRQGPYHEQPADSPPTTTHEKPGQIWSLLALVFGSIAGTIGVALVVLICLVAGVLAFVESATKNCCSSSSSSSHP